MLTIIKSKSVALNWNNLIAQSQSSDVFKINVAVEYAFNYIFKFVHSKETRALQLQNNIN